MTFVTSVLERAGAAWRKGWPVAALAVAMAARPGLLSAQITVKDTSSASVVGATSMTWSHTVTSGSNRALFAGISMEGGGGSSSGVTYGGTAMTLVGRGQNSHTVEIWRLLNPAVGTANIVASFGGQSEEVVGGAVSFDGVHQTTPTGTFAGASGSSNSPSRVVSSATGELVLDVLMARDQPTATAGAGQTARWNRTNGGSGRVRGAGSTEAGAASVTMSWTLGSSVQWQIGGVSIKPALTTTLGNGTDPANASLAPGGAATMADAFTFQTASGTDAITAVTVTLATGTSGGLSLVEITDDAGTVVYGSATNPASDTPAITLSTNITATTTSTQYKIRVTPKSHANMPAPSGSSYAVTARITAWTGTNGQAGSDAAGTTVTIDNLSPGNVTAATATAGNTQVALAWTNPADADLGSIVVLRRASSAVADVPAEGAAYTVGNSIGSSTVACVVTAPTATCTDTGLSNGTAYHYKIFARDGNGNYATGVVPSGSPATPSLTIITSVSPDGGANLNQLPSNGVNYSVSFNAVNGGNGADAFGLKAFGRPGGAVTIISVNGVAGDSANATIGAGSTLVVPVVYSIGSVASGVVDSIYLRAGSTAIPTASDTGFADLTVVRPSITIDKAVAAGGALVPGTELTYTVSVTNAGVAAASGVVVVDSLPASVDFKIGSDASTLPPGLSVALSYSDNAGATWTYTPVSTGCGAPAGFDRCVNRIRWTFTGTISATPPDNTAGLQFIARIR